MKPESVDILIKNGTILTVDAQRRIITEGSVAIRKDRIVAVGKTKELAPRHTAHKTIDARDKLVMPGLINGHCHFSGVKGLYPDNLKTTDWLRDWAYPYRATHTAEEEYYDALKVIAEVVKNGTTCFAEPGCRHLNTTIKAILESGVRCSTGQWLCDQGGPDAAKCLPGSGMRGPEETILKYEEFIDCYHGAGDGRVKIFVTMEGAGTCSDEFTRLGKELADKKGVCLLMHKASSREEAEAELQKTGHRPVEHLYRLGLLGPNVYLNHMVAVADYEVPMLAACDVKVSQNPSAALKLAKGTTVMSKFPEMIQQGVTVALGCDDGNSSDFRDIVRAMYLAATLPKDSRMDPTIITAEKVIEMATIDGARALHWDKDIGSIEVGKKADIVLFDMHRPEWTPTFNVQYSLVYSATGDSADTVIVDGKILMEKRRLLTIDEDAIINKIQDMRASVLSRSGLKPQSRWPIV